MTTSQEDLRALEGQYRESPFPPFSAWRTTSPGPRCMELAEEMEEARKKAPQAAQMARRFLQRAFAVDTGALEGLYETDAGLTLSIAMESASWQIKAQERGNLRRFFDAQLQSFQLLLDGVTGQFPLVEAWIRRLHEEICAAQNTYVVQTEQGPQERTLPKGQYKTVPNHVLTAEGGYFPYAPVADTPAEMQRLIQELNTAEFLAADPVVQASYAHYAFIRIHPFVDGNGRVARALATLYLLRTYSVPLLILVDQKKSYLSSLRAADRGAYQDLVDFFYNTTISAQQLFLEQIKNASRPSLEELAGELRQLVRLHNNFTLDDADMAAYRLHDAAFEAAREEVARLILPEEFNAVVAENVGQHLMPEGFRNPVKMNGRRLTFVLRTITPVQVEVGRSFSLAIGMEQEPEIILWHRAEDPEGSFRESMASLHPECSHRTKIRLAIWAEEQLRSMIELLREATRAKLKESGYRF